MERAIEKHPSLAVAALIVLPALAFLAELVILAVVA